PGTRNVWAICEDSSGTIWIGTSNPRQVTNLCRYRSRENDFGYPLDARPDLIGASVWSIRPVSNTLWLGTSNGLVQFDPRTGNVIHFRNAPEDPSTLSHNEVWSVFLDRSGSIWEGTWGGGLNRLAWTRMIDHPGTFEHFGSDRGIHSNIVYAITDDKIGQLWVSTSNGIFVLPTATDERSSASSARTFTTLDEVIEQEYNPNAVFR